MYVFIYRYEVFPKTNIFHLEVQIRIFGKHFRPTANLCTLDCDSTVDQRGDTGGPRGNHGLVLALEVLPLGLPSPRVKYIPTGRLETLTYRSCILFLADAQDRNA